MLRDFANEVIKKSPNFELLAEDDRLEKTDRITKAWWHRID